MPPLPYHYRRLIMKKRQNAKEVHLCLFGYLTGWTVGVTITEWSELATIERICFIFLSCLFAFITYVAKTERVPEERREGKQ